MLVMMYLLLAATRANPDRSAQYRECVSELAVTAHFEKVAQPVPSPRPDMIVIALTGWGQEVDRAAASGITAG
jgi:hypothetical protein